MRPPLCLPLHMEQIGFHWVGFRRILYWRFLLISVSQIDVCLKSENNQLRYFKTYAHLRQYLAVCEMSSRNALSHRLRDTYKKYPRDRDDKEALVNRDRMWRNRDAIWMQGTAVTWSCNISTCVKFKTFKVTAFREEFYCRFVTEERIQVTANRWCLKRNLKLSLQTDDRMYYDEQPRLTFSCVIRELYETALNWTVLIPKCYYHLNTEPN